MEVTGSARGAGAKDSPSVAPRSDSLQPSMKAVLVALLASVRASFRTRAALQLEVLALRHQLAVYRRRHRRARITRIRPLLGGYAEWKRRGYPLQDLAEVIARPTAPPVLQGRAVARQNTCEHEPTTMLQTGLRAPDLNLRLTVLRTPPPKYGQTQEHSAGLRWTGLDSTSA
jgi:hypothetical protein